MSTANSYYAYKSREQHYAIELSALMEMFCSALSNLAVTSHMWLLSSYNVISATKGMSSLFYLILTNLIVNSHMMPVATGSDSTGVEYRTVINLKGLF